MSEVPGEQPSLAAISGPSVAPADSPDALTQKAVKKAAKDAKRPSPSERLEMMYLKQIEETRAELDRSLEKNTRLQQQLNEIQPEYFKLKEASAHLVIWNTVSAIQLAVGGILVSAAGYFAPYVTQVLWFGIALAGCGTAMLVIVTGVGYWRRR